jgi:hypothetical protein
VKTGIIGTEAMMGDILDIVIGIIVGEAGGGVEGGDGIRIVGIAGKC